MEKEIPFGRHFFCDAAIMAHLGGTWAIETSDGSMREWMDEWGRDNYFYGIVEEIEGGKAVGIAGISEDTNPEEPGLELSWFILPAFQGRGYATEITRGLKTFVFEDLKKDRLFAETGPDNASSNRVLEKAGFTDRGMAKRSYDYLPGMNSQRVWEIKKE